jgi:hypothetical protein
MSDVAWRASDEREGFLMGMGAITWACLALAVHQGPSAEGFDFINGRDFEIPIRLNNPQAQANIRRLILYVSEEGQDWQVQQYAQPSQKAFIFRAKHDGKYLFIVGQEDNQNRTLPANPFRVAPNLRVIVDTAPPKIAVKAERLPGGNVLARWTISEEYPEPHSLRLNYHTDAMRPDQPWVPLDALSGPPGEKAFNPGSAGEVRVRVQFKDRAGNLGQGEAVVPAIAPAADASGSATIGVIPTIRRSDQPPPPGLLTSRQTPPRALDNPSPPSHPVPADAPMLLTPPAPRDDLNPNARPPAAPSSVAASPNRAAAAPGFAPETPRGALPPVQIVNKREVKLEFEVAKFGPSGLGGADVYVTVNEGATWERWPGDPPVTLPPIADGRGSTPVRGSVTVQLPREGVVYGILVAVKSKAGRGREAPKPGEPPEARIELDTTAPKAEMYEPQADLRQPDTLLLLWNAVDRNLPSTPIALEWAERKEGPWNSIGGEHLPNTLPAGVPPGDRITGAYAWRLPEHNMPSRVYLKLTVRDTAGNLAVALTDKPVLIDLSVPETKVIGVAPTSR